MSGVRLGRTAVKTTVYVRRRSSGLMKLQRNPRTLPR
jgi:hypothetical protein